MSTQTTPNFKPEINLAHELIQILKTVLLLERPYGAGYIARIVTGDSRFELRKVTHKQLETFGSLDEHSKFRIEDIVYHMIESNLLEVTDPQYGTIQITEIGRAWLNEPKDWIVNRKQVFTGWWGYELLSAIRNIRKEAAAHSGKLPYELFSNYALARIVHGLPQTEEGLREIPGMKNLDQATLLLILTAIHEIVEKKAEDAESGIHSKANSPSHRQVKDLYESGFSLEEIAQRRNLQTQTARGYLFTLHKAGKLDLNPWIEQHLDPKVLFKGTEYFRSVDDRRLKSAQQVLGMDYDTLAFCRLYAEKVGESPLEYAS